GHLGGDRLRRAGQHGVLHRRGTGRAMAATLALTGARRFPVLTARLLAAALLLAAWQGLAVSGLLFRDVVPGLELIALALARTLASMAFWSNLSVTAGEFLLAVVLGGLLGVLCGLALGASRFLGE